MRLRTAALIVASFATGLALARWWYRPGPGPARSVVIRYGLDGEPRVYGPTTASHAARVARWVGGRVAECRAMP